MKKSLLLILALICIEGATTAQTRTQRIVQVSGVIVATDSLVLVPYATIYRSADNRGTFSDYNGYFTMPVQAGDTLNFVCIGLKNSSYIVPDDSTKIHISMVQWMDLDPVVLPTVNILPYPSPDKLRQELLALDLPGDRYFRFTREIASVTRYDGLADLNEAAMNEASSTLITRYSNGFKSGGNLLDPVAWGNFVNALRSGRRKP